MAKLLGTQNLRMKGLPTLSGKGSRFGFRVWFIPIAIVLFGSVAWWTRSSLEATLKARITAGLQTILDADVAALEIWFEAHADSATNLNETTEVERLAAEIMQAAAGVGTDRTALRQIPASAALRAHLQPLTERRGYVGWGLTDRSGLLVATAQEPTAGQRLEPAHVPLVARAYDGETVFSHPFLSTFEANADSRIRPGEPAMFVLAPVRGADGEVFAVLGYAINVDEFTAILGIARQGESGETYAFDADGVLLSNSRFEDDLRAIGLLPADAAVGSALNIEIRDPGADLTTGAAPTAEGRARPLTRMAASASAGEATVDVEGYNDYRGVPVVGAWTWIDGYGFGVATEEDFEEAYLALNRLKTIQNILFGLLGIAGVAMMFESVVISRLGRQVTEAVLEARQLGQYTLEKKIGEGGMGEVHRARHAMLRRPTAVKLLRPDRAEEKDIARFEREVQLTSQLTHPNTIAIYDFGRTPDDIFYYAMEYLHGIDLQDLVDQTGALPPDRIIHILTQACGSLAEAHGISLIHRDIKPANLMLCDRGGEYDVVKVVDFGIVKELGVTGDAQLTQAGTFSGTPHYLAPETIQASNDVDARVDVYALGAVGYFLLTGTNMFPGDDPMPILTKQLTEAPEPPSARVETYVPADLERLILSCLEKDPGGRPQSARAMGEQLGQLKDAGTWTQRHAREWWALHTDLAGVSTEGGDTGSQNSQTIAIDVSERA